MSRRLEFGMLVSLDGYVAGPVGGPQMPMFSDELHQYFNDRQRSHAVSLNGRGLYEIMRYWEADDPSFSAVAADFSRAWRDTPKVVFSRTLREVGPNARLVAGDAVEEVRRLKMEDGGDMEVGGTLLAASLSRAGLIDEYRLYVRPVVLGGGKPFFADSRPELTLIGTETLADETILMRYAPASRN